MMLKMTKPPYADTEVDAEKTQQQITQLLRKYGVSQVSKQLFERINFLAFPFRYYI